jgi:hypothetical protein
MTMAQQRRFLLEPFPRPVRSCVQAIGEIARYLSPAQKREALNRQITHVSITGDTATAKLQNGTIARLIMVNGTWLIAAGAAT